jgi:nucleoside-diphosphate-sugar epimerase
MLINVMLFGKENIYNVGGVYVCNILKLAEIIGNMFNKKVKISSDENKLVGSPQIVDISIVKYLKEFKKEKFITLEEGIKNTINWQVEYDKISK